MIDEVYEGHYNASYLSKLLFLGSELELLLLSKIVNLPK